LCERDGSWQVSSNTKKNKKSSASKASKDTSLRNYKDQFSFFRTKAHYEGTTMYAMVFTSLPSTNMAQKDEFSSQEYPPFPGIIFKTEKVKQKYGTGISTQQSIFIMLHVSFKGNGTKIPQ